MKLLVIGSGGREHAIAWRLAQSPRVSRVYVAPGNAGTAHEDGLYNVDVTAIPGLVEFAKREGIHATVVGPEGPLAAGVVDSFRAAGLRVFGPTQAAAQLEASKDFAKRFMRRHGIPTARYETFTEAKAAHGHIEQHGAPIVIKADGLAAGKGVVVAANAQEAHDAIDRMLAGSLGDAGHRVVIEEFLEGEEASFIVMADGRNVLALPSSQDHKRVFDGDQGPNTGGMGAYSPAPIMDARMRERVMRTIVAPTFNGMAATGAPFKGVLFAGLMICADGPRLIEYNVRFGDPETQAVLPRLEEDLLALLLACVEERLTERPARLSAKTALSVVLAAKGYPGAPVRGSEIHGIERAGAMPFVSITHAGTKRKGQQLLADGGRVLTVTGVGADVAEARAYAYAAIDMIDWPGGFYRRDIGWRALERDPVQWNREHA
jgi:phosphoribosylamine--glycine ligase